MRFLAVMVALVAVVAGVFIWHEWSNSRYKMNGPGELQSVSLAQLADGRAVLVIGTMVHIDSGDDGEDSQARLETIDARDGHRSHASWSMTRRAA